MELSMEAWVHIGFAVLAAIVTAIATGITLYNRWSIKRAANAEVEGCIACSSVAVRQEEGRLICEDCGYVGRADRGGEVSYGQISASTHHLGEGARKYLRAH